MELNEYQEISGRTAVFPKDRGLEYCTIALTGEAGEFANEVKKVIRGDHDLDTAKMKMALELGDVLWYIAAGAEQIGFSLQEIADLNIEKLRARYAPAAA